MYYSDKTVINYETKTLTTIDEESILDYEVTNTSSKLFTSH